MRFGALGPVGVLGDDGQPVEPGGREVPVLRSVLPAQSGTRRAAVAALAGLGG